MKQNQICCWPALLHASNCEEGARDVPDLDVGAAGGIGMGGVLELRGGECTEFWAGTTGDTGPSGQLSLDTGDAAQCGVHCHRQGCSCSLPGERHSPPLGPLPALCLHHLVWQYLPWIPHRSYPPCFSCYGKIPSSAPQANVLFVLDSCSPIKATHG